MAKTEKELRELKKKEEELNKEFKALPEEELEQVAGGFCGIDRPGRGETP